MKNQNLAKKANGLFLTVVLVSVLANIFVSFLSTKGIKLHIVPNLLISQMIILIPGLLFYLSISKDNAPFVIFGKISGLSCFLLLVFTWLMMPLVTAANVFSQLFTNNEVMNISGDVLKLPLVPMVVIIGILGPFCEEFVFRGLINNCFVYQSERYVAAGLISGLFFGLMHMNFNQFCYAFVLGVVFAIIDEALGSIVPSFICHAIVNTQNVLMLYIADKLIKNAFGSGIFEMYQGIAKDQSIVAGAGKISFVILFSGLILISIVTTALAGLLFYGICAIEGKEEKLKRIFSKKEKIDEKKVLYPMGIIAITFCIFVMFLLEPIIKMLK